MRSEQKKDKPVIDPADVRDYLAAHPDFLIQNEDLLQGLTPPRLRNGANVTDFQQYMVERLQTDLARLDHYRDALISATRSNLVSQQQVHMAILTAFDAMSLEHFVHIVTRDWVDILDLDAVVLCVEARVPGNAIFGTAGIQLLEPDDIASLMGQENAILLRGDLSSARRDVFGPAADLVQAEALVRLAAGGTRAQGLLALGSRDPGHFAPGQGTELLRFLGAMTERMLDRWLSPVMI